MKNQAPNRWFILDLMRHCAEGPQRSVGTVYVPARPLGFDSWGSRFRLAWAVFTGRADAVFWGETPYERR